jgi:hypothetical protein
MSSNPWVSASSAARAAPCRPAHAGALLAAGASQGPAWSWTRERRAALQAPRVPRRAPFVPWPSAPSACTTRAPASAASIRRQHPPSAFSLSKLLGLCVKHGTSWVFFHAPTPYSGTFGFALGGARPRRPFKAPSHPAGSENLPFNHDTAPDQPGSVGAQPWRVQCMPGPGAARRSGRVRCFTLISFFLKQNTPNQ